MKYIALNVDIFACALSALRVWSVLYILFKSKLPNAAVFVHENGVRGVRIYHSITEN